MGNAGSSVASARHLRVPGNGKRDHDGAMGVAPIGPAGDQSQALIVCGLDPLGVVRDDLRGGSFFGQPVHDTHLIVIGRIAHPQVDIVPSREFVNVTEHLATDIVVPRKDRVAHVARPSHPFVESCRVVGHLPHFV